MPRIVVSIDGIILQEMTLSKDRTTLGRRPYNDIVIDNLSVSGEHAVLLKIADKVFLEDLDSTNGTSLNAQAVTRQALQHNDLIEICRYKIRYLITAGSDTVAVVAPAPAPDSSSFGTGLTVPGALTAVTAETTSPAKAGAFAIIKVLTGPDIGRNISLQKVATTIGKPGVAVAAVTRRLNGYMLTQVDGPALINALPLGSEAVTLKNGDVLELAATQMRFDQA